MRGRRLSVLTQLLDCRLGEFLMRLSGLHQKPGRRGTLLTGFLSLQPGLHRVFGEEPPAPNSNAPGQVPPPGRACCGRFRVGGAACWRAPGSCIAAS
jgi:hypothetical protein